ncbi:MAG: hypothetical protein MUO42_09465 [Anaerolineaceae bacterium]|nr:hypothetical protein [Anaerolineaceae bacterium]
MKKRTGLLELVSNSVSILDKENVPETVMNDLVAFIILSLTEIEKTITQTTAPWEIREYWVKADQFRSEWKWVSEIKRGLIQSRKANGWVNIPAEILLLAEKIKMVEPSKSLQGKNFWKGAYSVLYNQN